MSARPSKQLVESSRYGATAPSRANQPLSALAMDTLRLQRLAGNQAVVGLAAQSTSPQVACRPPNGSELPVSRSAVTDIQRLDWGRLFGRKKAPPPGNAPAPVDVPAPADAPAPVNALAPVHAPVHADAPAPVAAPAWLNVGAPGNAPARGAGPALGARLVTAKGHIVPQENFAGRSVTKFGVGETVNLSATTTSGTMAALGGLSWRMEQGLGGILRSTPGLGTGRYTCGERAGTASLVLSIAAGPRKDEIVDRKSVTVVKPTGGRMSKIAGRGIEHTHGMAGCGFVGDMWMSPTDVSFAAIEQREGSCAATATGAFSHVNGEVHPVSRDWKKVGPGDVAHGCRVAQVDTVYSGDLRAPFAVGSFTWPIPWEWQMPYGTPETYMTAVHQADVDAQGKMTISKAGSGNFSANVDDPDSIA